MKNLWIQTEHAFVTWIADFTAIATQPAAILEFAQAVLASGAKQRVFDVVEAPIIGYQRDRDGALGDVLGRLFEHDRVADVRDGVPVDHSARRLPVAVLIGIHSDIWFPWVYGSAHPDADHRRMFDNRELASRHTPRLNGFLGEVAAAARRVGGGFGVWPDGTGMRAINWVDDDGVLLDWEPEAGVMPPEALAAEWF